MNIRLHSSHICTAILAVCAGISMVSGADSDQGQGLFEQRDPVAEYLFAGWLAEREKIVTAHYVVEGGFEKDLYDPSISGDFTIESWLSPDAERYESKWAELKGFAASWIQLKDKVVSWPYGGGKAAVIVISETKNRDWQMCARIDPRLASLLGVMAFPDRLTPFRELREGYIHGYNYLDLKELRPGIFEFMLENRNAKGAPATYRTKVRINENNGFSIERMEQYERLPGRDLPGDLICWTDTEWRQIDDVWVPIRLNGECNERGTLSRKAHAEFNWLSVNKPISAERFDPADFAVPNGKIIVDDRTSDGIEVGRIDRSKPVSGDEPDPEVRLEQFLQPNLKEPIPTPPVSSIFSPRVVLILTVNLALIVGLLLAWRRKSRQTETIDIDTN